MLLGQAWSWGNNEFGQLGQGDNRHRRVPVPVSGTGPGGHTIVSVSLGQLLRISSKIVEGLCEGSNIEGAVGQKIGNKGSAFPDSLDLWQIVWMVICW